VVDVLVVCTANVARSPLFAARLAWEADRHLGEGAVEVGSAGTAALYGQPAAPGSRKVAAGWGLSLEGHRAVPVTHHDLATIPLILTMELAQRRDLTSRSPGLTDRCFTVPELARIVRGHLEERALHGLPPGGDGPRARIAAVAALAAARRPRLLTRRRGDVPDPIGADQPTYDALGERFAADAEAIGAVLFGPISG
jgi:protein-tyrosine phosphatase